MRVMRVDHIGIAIEKIDEIAPLLRRFFGGAEPHEEEVADQGIRAHCWPAGETSLEFLESLSEKSPVGRFLAKRGSGIHHVALAVDDLDGALDELREAGVPLIDEKPRTGAEGKKIAFLHPKGTGGILFELTQA